jgi:hypothetical protein
MTPPTKVMVTPPNNELVTTMANGYVGWVAAFTLLSWLGLFIHNRADLPHLPLLSPETSIPALISLLLFLGWWLLPLKRTMWGVLLSWALLNLIGGGILSVIPFSLLPYHPEQTVFHYLMHVQYTVTQIPLVVVLLRQARRSA